MRRAALSILLLSACASPPKGGNAKGDAGPADAGAPAPVEVVELPTGEIRDGVEGTATVEARQRAILRARVAGTVADFKIDEGSVVEAGDVLTRLIQPGVGGALSQARARAKKTRRDAKTLERLRKDGLVPAQELEEAQFAAEQARLEVRRLTDERAREKVISPLSGVITARSVQPGEAVSPGAELFRVANLSALEAHLRVPERHLPRLAPGLPVEIEADGLGEARLDGTVARIAPTVDPRSGTAKVTVDLKDGAVPGGGRLRPGMYIRARIIVDTRPDAVLVPKRAIIYEDDRAVLYTVVEGKAKRVTVGLGYADRDRVEARSGVQAGDAVIVFGHRGLQDGAPVRTLPAPKAAPASAPASEAP